MLVQSQLIKADDAAAAEIDSREKVFVANAVWLQDAEHEADDVLYAEEEVLIQDTDSKEAKWRFQLEGNLKVIIKI